MSGWFNLYTIPKKMIREKYAKDERYVTDEYIEQIQNIRMMDIIDASQSFYDLIKKNSPDNTKVIDEPDSDFSFFIEHPQEPKNHHVVKSKGNKPRTPINKELREYVLHVSGRKCRECSIMQDLQIHHLNGDRSDNRIANLEVLCYHCHKLQHKAESKIKR